MEHQSYLAETGLGPVAGTAFLMSDLMEAASWLQEYAPVIRSYFDSPKTLDELREGALTSRAGYDIHHVVEQTPAEKDGFPRSMIDAPENLVSVSRLKHWEITGWYMTENADYDGMSPRQFLKDKDWNARTRVGLDALKQFGILKP